ncbi:hypothetical protein [Nocardia macrotermitis]|uniref:hypothetical protein n=1 Tax=Nocardia macrotermitis TaxID=2585198 RepID=UPI001295DDFE|nr:hypothetical protein [Nocardia macrotermitis]
MSRNGIGEWIHARRRDRIISQDNVEYVGAIQGCPQVMPPGICDNHLQDNGIHPRPRRDQAMPAPLGSPQRHLDRIDDVLDDMDLDIGDVVVGGHQNPNFGRSAGCRRPRSTRKALAHRLIGHVSIEQPMCSCMTA